MQVSFEWQSGMAFAGGDGDHTITMDAKAPLGKNSGMTPKHMLLAGVCGCTGMDVAALLRKHKMEPKSLVVEATAETLSTHPAVFREILVRFVVEGEVALERLLEAISLSQTKYCGVSAMVAAVSPIRWQAVLNGQVVGSGQADFGAVGSLASS
jgi:putative redox protein